MSHDRNNARALLTELGVGGFNATMIIQYLFVGPFTTDPKSPMIMLLVKHLQMVMNQMGASLTLTGALDRPTADALNKVLGAGWINGDWSDVITGVLTAKRSGYRFQAPAPVMSMTPVAGFSLPSLPDVPGGMLTYAAGAALLWHFMKKRKR